MYIVGAVFVVIVLVVYFGLFHNSAPLDTGDTTPPAGEFADMVGDVETWQNYDGGSYSFSYPTAMRLSEGESGQNVVTVDYAGPTQIEASEFFDGIVLNFVERSLTDGLSLQEAVEAEAEYAATIGEVSQPVTATSLGGVDGWVYEFVGVGNFQSYFLPSTDENYVMVVVVVEDPADQGFEEVKDKILASLRIL
jgi:hypothetical protein